MKARLAPALGSTAPLSGRALLGESIRVISRRHPCLCPADVGSELGSALCTWWAVDAGRFPRAVVLVARLQFLSVTHCDLSGVGSGADPALPVPRTPLGSWDRGGQSRCLRLVWATLRLAWVGRRGPSVGVRRGPDRGVGSASWR